MRFAFSVDKDQIPVLEKKPLIWEEDMELYSKFLDRKVCVIMFSHLHVICTVFVHYAIHNSSFCFYLRTQRRSSKEITPRTSDSTRN